VCVSIVAVVDDVFSGRPPRRKQINPPMGDLEETKKGKVAAFSLRRSLDAAC
jgi:hypothetical protein